MVVAVMGIALGARCDPVASSVLVDAVLSGRIGLMVL